MEGQPDLHHSFTARVCPYSSGLCTVAAAMMLCCSTLYSARIYVPSVRDLREYDRGQCLLHYFRYGRRREWWLSVGNHLTRNYFNKTESNLNFSLILNLTIPTTFHTKPPNPPFRLGQPCIRYGQTEIAKHAGSSTTRLRIKSQTHKTSGLLPAVCALLLCVCGIRLSIYISMRP